MAGIIGIPGRHQSEAMAAFVRNRGPASSESATAPTVSSSSARWRRNSSAARPFMDLPDDALRSQQGRSASSLRAHQPASRKRGEPHAISEGRRGEGSSPMADGLEAKGRHGRKRRPGLVTRERCSKGRDDPSHRRQVGNHSKQKLTRTLIHDPNPEVEMRDAHQRGTEGRVPQAIRCNKKTPAEAGAKIEGDLSFSAMMIALGSPGGKNALPRGSR
jgi:hypothetical protein